MNKLVLIVVALAGAVTLGFLVGRSWQPDSSAASDPGGEREIAYWVAPMDPNFRRDGPGKSPMGMDLVPVYADQAQADAPGLVSIDPQIVNNLGVRSAPVGYGELMRTIDTVGRVAYAEDTLATLDTRVAGWVETLGVAAEGDPVRAGQLLYELYSPDLINAQREYLAVLRGGAPGLIAAARERLRTLGLDTAALARLDGDRRVRQRQQIRAAQDGVVVRLHVRAGAYVMPGRPIMTVAALEQVWVEAEVIERQAGWLANGQPAEVEFEAYPGRVRRATVDYVYPELDPVTRTLGARLVLDNDAALLRPGMLARVRIGAGGSGPVLHVPRTALIRGGAGDRVVLALGDGRFRSVAVLPGMEYGDRVAILDGLSSDDRVVVSGQFLIDSESNIDSALTRLSAAEPVPEEVTLDGVVEGWRVGSQRLTVQHEPVPEWDWPAMSMGFDVAEASLLDDLELGQAIRMVVSRRPDDSYVVTDIGPVGRPAGGHQHTGEQP